MKKIMLLSTAALALCLAAVAVPAHPAQAGEETGTLYYYDIPPAELQAHYYEWKRFLEYNMYREPCQHYRDPPAGYVLRGCDVYRVGAVPAPIAVTVAQPTVVTESPPVVVEKTTPYLEAHTIYFDFDRSRVRLSEQKKIKRVADEIRADNRGHVLIAGHADRSGPPAYNMRLSQARVHAVTQALIAEGIRPEVLDEVLDKRAYGETDLAVPTADGVKLEANRRVYIDFGQ